MAKALSKKKSKMKTIPAKALTRKEQRKQKQIKKKENKRIFFSNKTQGKQLVAAAAAAAASTQVKKKSAKRGKQTKLKPSLEDMTSKDLLSGVVDSEDSIASDFSDDEVNARMAGKITQKSTASSATPGKRPAVVAVTRVDAGVIRQRELKRQKDIENASRKQRRKQLVVENEEEERIISRLEKKLKLNKVKDKNRSVRKMFNDGLDYALELCLDDEEEMEKKALKKKRAEELKRQEEAGGWSDFDEEEAGGDDDDGALSDGSGDDAKDDSDDDNEGVSNESDEENDLDSESDEGHTKTGKQKSEYTEDIYGRKRDKDGNVIKETGSADMIAASQPLEAQKYVPPHQRAALRATGSNSIDAEKLERLRKNVKGLLNRLSEANLHRIASNIEELYMKNSRYNMNETLTVLMNEALINGSMANERMVQEHMVLLAYLHGQIGSEIGAHFLQMFIEQFDKHIKAIASLRVDDKRLNNLVLVLSYMYIFKLYEHRLLLELIDSLSNNLCEKSIECLLLVFQSVGFKLRKDDPFAFKQMMTGIQKRIADAPLEMKENLRLKFMVDILNAVKNNNISKIPQFDPELAENLRKRLKAMLRNDKYVVTLNITMADLLRADQVGKWWVVGSAWSGNIDDLAAAAAGKAKDAHVGGQQFSEKLLLLAKRHKMNTEERRNIFCILMSAEDYVDAFEKILQLSLKDQRSIAYVILHCCLNDKQPNPYYAHLAKKFCDYNRKFQLAFQFAAWDRINDMQSLNKQQVRNLAQLLQHLIRHGGLALSVLKVVDFVQLDKLSSLLMKEIMTGLLLAPGEEGDIYVVFERVAKSEKLSHFKNSLRLFLQHFLLQQDGAKLKLPDEQRQLLQSRVEYVNKLLAHVDL